MANPEHVEIVKRGADAINEWRKENPGTILDLYRAVLQGAVLQGADLRGAVLRGAVLQGADLRGAVLLGADLRGAVLQGADLQGADLQGADLRGAVLQGAVLQGAVLPNYQICPEEGAFICYKKLTGDVVATLLVPDGARRCCNLISRKIRVERVRVLDGEGYSPTCFRNQKLHYAPGGEVVAHAFNNDIRIDCAPGIHVFITRKEAEEW